MRHRALIALGLSALALLAPSAAQAERLVFSSNSGSLGGVESVTAFVANPGGSLDPNPRVSVGDRPEGLAVSPDGRFLYVATSVTPGVRAYAIGSGGTLTEIADSPFPSGGINTTGVAVTPSGDFLLVSNRGTALNNAVDPGSIAVYEIDKASGGLTQVPSSPFAIGGLEDSEGIAIAPDGGRAFVTGDAAGATFDARVAALAIDSATGALSQLTGSPFDSGGKQAFPIVISPDGGRVFVGNVSGAVGGSTISVLTVDEESGALAPIAGSPFPAAGTAPIGLSLSPDGDRLFAGERAPEGGGNEGVSAYDIATDGKLAAVTGSPFAIGGQGSATVVSADGEYVYAIRNAEVGAVAGFSIGGTGSLTALTGSPYPTGDKFAGFLSIAATPIQTPKPAFRTSKAEADLAASFDASGTTVPGGEATRFDWDFGDGTSLANGGRTPIHAFAALGTYKVTLTVTNDCDPDAVFTDGIVFTGQTAHCVGPREAKLSQTVAVVDTVAPDLTRLIVSKRFVAGNKPTPRTLATASPSRVKVGTRIGYSLSETARVRIRIQKAVPRRAGKGTRFAKRGALIRQGKAGRNAVRFSGRVGKSKPLSPGRYRIVVTATDPAGNTSESRRKSFRIVAPPD